MSSNFPVFPTGGPVPSPPTLNNLAYAVQELNSRVARVVEDVLYRGDGAFGNFRHTGGASLERWYCAGQANATALTTGAPTADVLRAIPFVAPARGGKLDRLAWLVTAGTIGNGRIGLYENNQDERTLYPAKLLEDSGSISVQTNAVKSYTPANRVLLPGRLYWLAYVSSVAPTMRCMALAAMMPVLGTDNTLPVTTSVGVSVAHVYAALPDPFTAGGAEITAVPVPSLFARFSA